MSKECKHEWIFYTPENSPTCKGRKCTKCNIQIEGMAVPDKMKPEDNIPKNSYKFMMLDMSDVKKPEPLTEKKIKEYLNEIFSENEEE